MLSQAPNACLSPVHFPICNAHVLPSGFARLINATGGIRSFIVECFPKIQFNMYSAYTSSLTVDLVSPGFSNFSMVPSLHLGREKQSGANFLVYGLLRTKRGGR